MLLSLDIATVTGWAFRIDDDIIYGTHDFTAVNHDHAVLGRRFHWWVADLITEHGHPKEMVIERPFYMQRSPQAGILLHKLCHEAERVAEIHDIPRKYYEPTTIKKFITGSGRATKTQVMDAVKALGHDIKTEHEADAVALLLLRESEID